MRCPIFERQRYLSTQAAITSAINDTLKAIAASLLMEQVLQPRFKFTPKNAGAKDGYGWN